MCTRISDKRPSNRINWHISWVLVGSYQITLYKAATNALGSRRVPSHSFSKLWGFSDRGIHPRKARSPDTMTNNMMTSFMRARVFWRRKPHLSWKACRNVTLVTQANPMRRVFQCDTWPSKACIMSNAEPGHENYTTKKGRNANIRQK